MILIPTVVDLDEHRRKRNAAEPWRVARAARSASSLAEPVAAPVDPRAFCAAAIRRELAEDFDGPAAA